MSLLRYIWLGCVSFLVLIICIANRNSVIIALVPNELSGFFAFPTVISVPLFVIILGSIAIGLVIGILKEWLRERAIRSDAALKAHELRRLEREITRLKGAHPSQNDDVLALLDKT